MWTLNEKAIVNDLLKRFMGEHARDLVMRYFEVIKAFESSFSTGGNPLVVAEAFADMLTGFRGNEVFERHAHTLHPIMVNGYVAWVSFMHKAGKFDDSVASDSEKAAFVMARNQFKEVAVSVFLLVSKNTYDNDLRQQLMACEVL